MRISDWSSDVCSSDLAAARPFRGHERFEKMVGNLLGSAGAFVDHADFDGQRALAVTTAQTNRDAMAIGCSQGHLISSFAHGFHGILDKIYEDLDQRVPMPQNRGKRGIIYLADDKTTAESLKGDLARMAKQGVDALRRQQTGREH